MPGPGGSHKSWSTYAQVPQLLSKALEPASLNYWAHSPQLLSLCAATTEARVPTACAPQGNPPQTEAHALKLRPSRAKR